MNICIIDGCTRPKHVRSGLCSAHHARVKRYGDPHFVKHAKTPRHEKLSQCKVDGCEKKPYGHNLCKKHYQRMAKYGDPLIFGRTPPGTLMAWLEDHISHQGDECLEWPFYSKANGYGLARIDGKSMNASRAMCILTHGNPEFEYFEAAHSCGNGHLGCVNPRHLSWKTPIANNADKVLHGTQQFGEKVKMAKLKECHIPEIVRLLKLGVPRVRIAPIFGVSRATIDDIANRKTWVRSTESIM